MIWTLLLAFGCLSLGAIIGLVVGGLLAAAARRDPVEIRMVRPDLYVMDVRDDLDLATIKHIQATASEILNADVIVRDERRNP